MLDAQQEQKVLEAQLHDIRKERTLVSDQLAAASQQSQQARSELVQLREQHAATASALATAQQQLEEATGACALLQGANGQLQSTVQQQTADIALMDDKYCDMEVRQPTRFANCSSVHLTTGST